MMTLLKHTWLALQLMMRRDLRVIAGGMAFFFMLSLVPLASFMVFVIGLVITPQQAEALLTSELGVLPGFVSDYLDVRIAGTREGFSFDWRIAVIGLLGLWSAMAGMKTLISGLHDVTEDPDPPGLLAFQGLALLIVFLLILIVGIAFPVASAVAGLLSKFTLVPGVGWLGATAIRLALSGLCLALIYRIILSRTVAGHAGCIAGGLVAAVIWHVAGYGLALYLEAGSLTSVYGTLAGLIFFLIWLYTAAMTLLFGGAIARRAPLPTY